MPDTREFDFLLAATRRFFRPDRYDLASPEGLDWNTLLRLAKHHGVTGFLRHACHSPELRIIAKDASLIGLTLSAELLKLLDLFERHAIEVVPLKGPILGASLYGDATLKSSTDLDLLVRREDAVRAIHALLDARYPLTSAPHWMDDRAYLRDPNCELSFSYPPGNIKIDLHWSLLPSYYPAPIDDTELWSKLRWVEWESIRARTLAPEHLLLFLYAHGAKHLWERLGWLCDAARILQVECDLDWDYIFAQTRRTDTCRMLSLGFTLASDLLGIELPDAALKLMRPDSRTQDLAARMIEQLRRGTAASPLLTAVLRLRSFERIDNRIRLALGTLCQPTEAEFRAVKMPPSLYWMYYLVRPSRLALKYTRQIIGL